MGRLVLLITMWRNGHNMQSGWISSWMLNGIRSEAKKKRQVFLATIGPSLYKLLRNLLPPQKPADAEYDTLRSMLQEHYNPKPSEIVQRFKFHTRTRRTDESVSDFLSQLRALA